MGIAAVPGSGKTWTLSLLAAELISRGVLGEDQEVLVVTLVNSAVDNFYSRVSAMVRARELTPFAGYRVRTLHGLAHDIVRERPYLVGLENNFTIVDEREADAIRDEAAQGWLDRNPDALDEYLLEELDEGRREGLRQGALSEVGKDIASSAIRFAKDLQLTPQELRLRLDRAAHPLPLAEMAAEIYAEYQRLLAYRGAVDFDDLIRLALEALRADPIYLERLRSRWPYILEDEAQDSSRLQEEILKTLAGPQGNWVRVGDPNQAIYSTFTTADPRFLRDFLRQPGVIRRELSHSGRSTASIIYLANSLVEWAQGSHPLPEARAALQAPPFIEPAGPGDPQPNPPDDPAQVRPVLQKLNPMEEIASIADSLERWLPEHPEQTVAVLAPRNAQGFELVDELRRRNLDVVDSLLRSTSATRFSAGVLGNLLRYLSDPVSSARLATVFKVWRRADREDDSLRVRMENSAEMLRRIGQVEDFLWPGLERDWLLESGLLEADPEAYEQLVEFRGLVRRWQAALPLPVDQILLTLAQDLLREPEELALAHKLALLLRSAREEHPDWRLPELTQELITIARNERRFLGFTEDDTGFDPERYKGRPVVSTIHKAKGLEWDRVYLMSVSGYDFPAGLPGEEYISEKWFVRGQLNLEAEGLGQIREALAGGDYQEGEASQQARLDYVRERLRLLYVGLTRARKELILTWNTGRRGEGEPAAALEALANYWPK
jgi:DNA helicase-2/ATP-dependent DNA helicase PcrA